MSPDRAPRVSVGLPVYNGVPYVSEAIESVLGQTFGDFELLIVDNASTDATEEICRAVAARDSRVRYWRNPQNIGLARNHNLTFERSSGEYFKWLSADDLCEPAYLERCVEALDASPEAVVAYPLAKAIDGDGKVLHEFEWLERVGSYASPDAAARFRTMAIEFTHDGWSSEDSSGQMQGGGSVPLYLFALIRSSALRATRLMASHHCADQNLLADLVLMGSFIEVPEQLSLIRIHGGAGSHMLSNWDPKGLQSRLDPEMYQSRIGRSISMHRKWADYAVSVSRADLGLRQKASLYSCIGLSMLRRIRLRAGKEAGRMRGGSAPPRLR